MTDSKGGGVGVSVELLKGETGCSCLQGHAKNHSVGARRIDGSNQVSPFGQDAQGYPDVRNQQVHGESRKAKNKILMATNDGSAHSHPASTSFQWN